MGNAVCSNEPVTACDTRQDIDEQLWLGCASVQGWRIDMEDQHCWRLFKDTDVPGVALFGVFDGHGGPYVSHAASELTLNRIYSQLVPPPVTGVIGSQNNNRPELSEQHIVDSLQQGIMDVEWRLYEENNATDVGKYDLSGSTCIVVLLHANRLYCANVGDSRAVASIGGNAVQLSIEHKPYDPDEERRIQAAGVFLVSATFLSAKTAYIEGNRVNGNLALSRALGDFFFKRCTEKNLEEQAITAFPDVTVFDMDLESWEFIIIACDGIWDVMSNSEVIDFVRSRLAAGQHPSQICEDLSFNCMAPDCSMGGLGCDNMTTMIVCFIKDANPAVASAKCFKAKSRKTMTADGQSLTKSGVGRKQSATRRTYTLNQHIELNTPAVQPLMLSSSLQVPNVSSSVAVAVGDPQQQMHRV